MNNPDPAATRVAAQRIPEAPVDETRNPLPAKVGDLGIYHPRSSKTVIECKVTQVFSTGLVNIENIHDSDDVDEGERYTAHEIPCKYDIPINDNKRWFVVHKSSEDWDALHEPAKEEASTPVEKPSGSPAPAVTGTRTTKS